MKRIIFLVGLVVVPFWAQAGSLYLCAAYNGGSFWAQSHCNQHSALIERIANVPDSLPFQQQVELAEQQRREATTNAANSATNTATHTVTTNSSALNASGECKALSAHVVQLDAMARQLQSGQTQDWIRSEKKQARDRQFALRC
jgi:hypothetical protein